MPTDQTQVPAGQEQSGQPPSTPPSDLEKRLADLQDSLAAKDKELKAKDAEARRLQAAADQRANLLARIQQTNQPPAPQQGRVPSQQAGVPQQQQVQKELAEFANDQAKEVTLLREVLKRGLALEDVEGLTFETQAELSTQLDLMQQKKEIAELRAQLSKDKEASPSGPQIDTGGRSVPAAQQQLAQVTEARKKAGELKQDKRYQEATWLALRAARLDPEKRSLVRDRPEDNVE